MKRRETIAEKLLYREPMLVTKKIVFNNNNCYPKCPRCSVWFEFDYATCCPYCGQLLKWKGYSRLKPIYV